MKISLPLLILFAASAFFFSVVRAQPPKDTSPPSTSTKLSPEEIERVLQTIEDPTIADDDEAKLEADEKFGALPLAQRLPLYRRLVASSNDGVAAGAIQVLLRSDDVESEPLIEKRMVSLSIESQGEILNHVLEDSIFQPKPFYFRLARQELQRLKLVEQSATRAEDPIVGRTAGLTALILANGRSMEDKDLVSAALIRFPKVSQLWFATALMQDLGPEETKLARTLYSAKQTDENLRFAIAVVLAPTDRQALTAVTTKIQGFLETYGSKPALTPEIIVKSEKFSWDDFERFWFDNKMIARLRFLRTNESQVLTFQALQSQNASIQRAAALVAASKYPEQLLSKFGQPNTLKITQAEKDNLLAFIAIRHPSLQPKVRLRLKNYDAIVDRVRRKGYSGTFDIAESVAGL